MSWDPKKKPVETDDTDRSEEYREEEERREHDRLEQEWERNTYPQD